MVRLSEILLIIVVIGTFIAVSPPPADAIDHTGDIVLTGSTEMVIENVTYTQTGNIYVHDNAKLIISNATLIINQHYHEEWGIVFSENAYFEVSNSTIDVSIPDECIEIIFQDSASVAAVDSNLEEGRVLAYFGVGADYRGVATISNTSLHSICPRLTPTGSGKIHVSDCPFINTLGFDYDGGFVGEFSDLRPGLFTSWVYNAGNWDISIQNTSIAYIDTSCVGPSEVVFRNCDISQFNARPTAPDIYMKAIDSQIEQLPMHRIENVTGELHGLRPGHYDYFRLRDHVTGFTPPDVILENSDIVSGFLVSVYCSHILIDDSILELRSYGVRDDITTTNSHISSLMLYLSQDSVLNFDNVTLDSLDVYVPAISVTIKGNIDFSSAARVSRWYGPSTVNRQYPVQVQNNAGNPISGANLHLYAPDNHLVWNGTTDTLGRASFTLSFTDSNYTDTLRLEAVKGNLFDTQGVTLLSDTPIVLTALAQYNLSISSTTGGNVTMPGQGMLTYDEGKVVNLVASLVSGYKFVNWTGDVGTIADVNDATTTVTMSGDYSITANFQEVLEHTLTISAVGGSVTTPGEGDFKYEEGTAVGLEAISEDGYRFVEWTGDVDTIANAKAASTTIIMNGDYSITANFEAAGGCFIATAAYGTPMAKEIQILREFRDEYMLADPLGQAIVDVYYTISPPMADFINEHPSLKPIVRAGLMPIVAMCSMVLGIVP
jgi:hypothetical protein